MLHLKTSSLIYILLFHADDKVGQSLLPISSRVYLVYYVYEKKRHPVYVSLITSLVNYCGFGGEI